MTADQGASSSLRIETGSLPPTRRLPALRDLFDRSIGMEIAAERDQPVDLQIHAAPGLRLAVMLSPFTARAARPAPRLVGYRLRMYGAGMVEWPVSCRSRVRAAGRTQTSGARALSQRCAASDKRSPLDRSAHTGDLVTVATGRLLATHLAMQAQAVTKLLSPEVLAPTGRDPDQHHRGDRAP